MTYSGVISEYTVRQCINCGYQSQSQARFCGGCGIDSSQSAANVGQAAKPQSPAYDASDLSRQYYAAPAFAKVQATVPNKVVGQLHAEAGKIMVLLARERIFLYLQWAAFLGINFLGVFVACKCYHEFLGDEVSKVMIASTPFLFINTVALLFVIPIKGTRHEINRLKEKLAHIRFKIEFGHLV